MRICRDLIKGKSDDLEHDARQAKEQLAEMARTATEYSTMIQKREEHIARLVDQLESSKGERDHSLKQIIELQSDIDTLFAELEAEKGDRAHGIAARAKLQEELDELRTLMDAKTSEETRRNEVEKSKEQELADLRGQVSKLQQDLSEARRLALEGQSKLKLELDYSVREHSSLQQSHTSLLERERIAQSQLIKVQATLSELEKAKRVIESELQSLRSRQNDSESQLADAQRVKEVTVFHLLQETLLTIGQGLERHLATAQARYQDFEDVVLQMERDKSSHDRQLEATRKQLEGESTKRAQLERALSSQKTELAKLKDRNVKLDRELNKALTELKAREWEVKQLESRQDKTIVEHVHVLEEAKRVTDRQLADAQVDLQKNAAYIRSLEKIKTRLTSEAEDLARETERERVELKSKEKTSKAQEEKAARALADVEKERRAKEAAELQSRRLQTDFRNAQHQVAELSQQLAIVQRSKNNLETELDRLADETETPNSMAKMQRQYETRIAQLEGQLGEAESAKLTAAKIRERVEHQHAEIRQLVMTNGPVDATFQARLLRELQLADDELEKEMSSRSQQLRPNKTNDFRSLANVTPSKRHPDSSALERVRRESHSESPRTPDRQVSALKQHVQVLEIQMAASERVRRHLETSIREMTADLENSDGSKQFLQQYRARLSKENARLAELLEEEGEARRAAEASQVSGVQAIWTKFQTSISEERENYSRLEESRKALVSQLTITIDLIFSQFVRTACPTTHCTRRTRDPTRSCTRAHPVQETAAIRSQRAS